MSYEYIHQGVHTCRGPYLDNYANIILNVQSERMQPKSEIVVQTLQRHYMLTIENYHYIFTCCVELRGGLVDLVSISVQIPENA